jgi:DNA-binding GntR family transcriptional regulator
MEAAVTTAPGAPAIAQRRSRPPLARISTLDALVQVITREIIDGALSPGMHLIETELAEEHGVSRQSLRSALAELVHLGLLERQPHRGVRVPRLTLRQVTDLWYVRGLIDLEAVRRGTRIGVDWSPLDGAARRILALNSDSSWADEVEADLDFHRALVATAGSLRLTRAHELLMSEMRLSLAGNVGREEPGFMGKAHQDLVCHLPEGCYRGLGRGPLAGAAGRRVTGGDRRPALDRELRPSIRR